jgi:hypothetical protein
MERIRVLIARLKEQAEQNASPVSNAGDRANAAK